MQCVPITVEIGCYPKATERQQRQQQQQKIVNIIIFGHLPIRDGIIEIRSFLALLCATAQQIYCRQWASVVRRLSSSFIRRHHFLGNRQLEWHQILVAGTYP